MINVLGSMGRALRDLSRPRQPQRTAPLSPLVYHPDVDIPSDFYQRVAAAPPRGVLEVGTLQARPGYPSHSRDRFPYLADSDYVKCDIAAGADVDVVADLHALPSEWSDRFGAFIAHAVFEHLERPWIAAREVARVLSPGGVFLVVTHQTFPLHGFPQDFFRFSREALRLIFEDAGLVVEAADYQHRCMIVPPESVIPRAGLVGWNSLFPSYILVAAWGRKPMA